MPENKKTRKVNNNSIHMQPQAVDIEKMVLGALMVDKDAFSVVSEILHPETFTNRVVRKYTRLFKL